MEKEYIITGMSCGGCVANVKKSLESINGVEEAIIQLDSPQGKLKLQKTIPLNVLQDVIGHYEIRGAKKDVVAAETK